MLLTVSLLAAIPVPAPLPQDAPATSIQEPTADVAGEASASAVLDTSFAGTWEGRILGAGLDIEVRLDQAPGGAWSGTISIPTQGMKDYALEGVAAEGERIRFAIPGIPGSPKFSGALDDGGATLAGDFRQSGTTLRFELRRAGDAETFPLEGLEGLRPWIDQTRADWFVPGLGVAIVRNGQVVMAEGFGLRDASGKLPVDSHTAFQIGSSTKAFMTFALAQAIDEGSLDWNDKVGEIMPGFGLVDEDAARALSVRDTVTHRLGLPRHDLMWYGRPDMDAAAIVAGMRHLAPNAELRERFQYNNLGYVLAGEILRTATGSTWGEWVESRIFQPLVMRDSTTSHAAFLRGANHAVGHIEEDTVVRTIPVRDIDNAGPAGAIGSSAHDMARWAQLHLDSGTYAGQEILSAAALDELHLPQFVTPFMPSDPMLGVTSYAHGWFIDSYRGHLRVQHGGNIDGFSAMVALFPADDLAVVCLANLNDTAVPEYVVRRVADVAFGLEPRGWSEGDLDNRDADSEGDAEDSPADGEDPLSEGPRRVEGTAPSHDLGDYVGAYEDDGYGTIKVTESKGALSIQLGLHELPLEHWHYDTFRADASDMLDGNPLEGTLVHFETSMEGDIVRLLVRLDPSVDPVEFEVAADPALADKTRLGEFVGIYTLDDLELTVSFRGDGLVVSVPGQPTFPLVPGRDNTFGLEGADGYSLHFRTAASGLVDAVELRQPNGTFLAKRSMAQASGD